MMFRNLLKLGKRDNRHKPEALKELFLNKYPMSSGFAESFRTLRTNIQFSFMEKQFRSLLVTSASEGEGKTSTVANLGFTMAKGDKAVLMIDADLRKPTLSGLISSDHGGGLTGLLSDTFSTDIGSGSLSEFSVSDLFRLLSFQSKTGRLHLHEGEEKIDAYFLRGEMVDLDWLTRPKEKGLATILVREKLVTVEQAKQALARKRDTGQKLGITLINMGLAKEDQLAGFITHQMTEGLRVALQFRSGDFSFENLPDAYFDRPAFNPADLSKLYKQLVLGEENLPYLQSKIGATIEKTGIDNLFVLPSGRRPPNPTELLDSKRMSFLLSYLKRRFDRVVLDSPPILPASDAVTLAGQADGVLLMIKTGGVNREMVLKAVDQLRMAQANLVGVVLSQMNVKRGGYYNYYRKYYSSYYGESAEQPKRS